MVHSRYSGSLVDEEFCDDLFNSSIYSLKNPFEASDGHPRAMISIAQGFESDKEAFHRHELFSIMAVMVS